MGIHDPRSFSFLTPPEQDSIVKSFELLQLLGAVDESLNLTPKGKRMSKLPLDPVFANLLLESEKLECVSEVLTVVGMLSAENIFFRPSRGSEASDGLTAKGAAAHKRFASYEGDLPSLLKVYNAWKAEAVYYPPGKIGKQHKKRMGSGKMLHGDWCKQNFISGRALVRAHDVRNQISELASRSVERNGLGMNVLSSCDDAEMLPFLKCIAAGLYLQVAMRIPSANQQKGVQLGGKSGIIPSRGHYKTKVGGNLVSIHPTSFMFNRSHPPKCVAYTEILYTSKLYIRGVTQIRPEWLEDDTSV
eukprot:scaffold55934_cov25-Cyclotella_meneghiniana.AAC.1